MHLPADADFITARRDRVVWDACGASCRLHVTDLTAGADVVVPLPANWLLTSETYPPPASFDRSGQRLVLPLDRVDSSGDATAQALFIADMVARTLRMIPGNGVYTVHEGTRAGNLYIGLTRNFAMR